ncbi:MAG TPA: hypothetical protein DHN33_06295, partial [Eubacteriaceae bacterium]|nr:hypothetical protein [Eubacteriaceae bacterium]
ETLSAVHSITDNGDGTYNLTIAKGGDLTDLEERNNVEEADVDGLKAGDAVFYNETTGDYAKADVKEGKIGGHQEALAEIDARVTDLDTFARGVATLVNTVHRDATENTSDGSPGIDFFTFGGGGETALNFQINQAIRADESLVATGADESAAPGDGSGALAIANLRNTEVRFDEIGSITYDSSTMTVENQDGGVTMEGKYRDMVIKVGISTQHADNMVDNQEALMAQLSNRRESVSGVSIDEEVTNLIKFQQSYNANSRVISTVSEMLDTLINRTGL